MFIVGIVLFLGCIISSVVYSFYFVFFFSSRRRHTRCLSDWSSDVCSSDLRRDALDMLRPGVALYAGFFPRYNRVLAESGYPEAVRAIKTAWDSGDRAGAVRAVPDELIDAVAIAATPDECRERVEGYRRAGLRLPIISPRGDTKQSVMAAIRAFAP